MTTLARYTGSDYRRRNRDWHVGDSAWKVTQVIRALGEWRPTTVCEVGCGAGEILLQLHDRIGPRRLVGYDIAPAAMGSHAGGRPTGSSFGWRTPQSAPSASG